MKKFVVVVFVVGVLFSGQSFAVQQDTPVKQRLYEYPLDKDTDNKGQVDKDLPYILDKKGVIPKDVIEKNENATEENGP